MKTIIKVIYSDIRELVRTNSIEFTFGSLWVFCWLIISNVIIHYGCPAVIAWTLLGPFLSAFASLLLMYLFLIVGVFCGIVYDYICSVISRAKELTKE